VKSAPVPRQARAFLILAFGGITVLFLLSNFASLRRMRSIEDNVDNIVYDAEASVSLVSGMGMDIQQEQLLLDRHIFEKEDIRMAQIERQITLVEASYYAKAHSYEPLAHFPGEAAAWSKLKADFDLVRDPIQEVLALSRQNQDVRAREKLAALEPRLSALRQDVRTLVAINEAEAERKLGVVISLQK
jgi:hypothetical protein